MRRLATCGVSAILALGCSATAHAACYSAPVSATSVPAAGTTWSFLIYKGANCAWFLPPAGNVISNNSWITIRNDIWYGYAGDGIFAFDVAKNTGPARFGTITAAGITFLVRQFGATDAIPITGPAVPNMAFLDTLMTNAMKEFNAPGGSLSVSYKGKLVYARGFGYADLATQELVQPDSMFRLASVSKLMTEASITNLESHNALTKTSKALTILSNLGPPPGLSVVDNRWFDITVDELINHTGGFLRTNVDRALDNNYLKSATTALSETMPGDNTAVIRYAMSKSLDYTPGSPPNPCPDCYSNFGYQILGRIIEKVTGGTYENYIRNTIMAPAGVTRTRAAKTYSDQHAPGEVHYYGEPSELFGDSVWASLPGPALSTDGEFVYEHYDSFGGMISNAMDVLRFYIYWLNWGPNSGFYGSLPGTNTAVFTLAANGDVKYSFLFNYRSDYSRTNTATCTSGSPCDLQVAVHNDLEAALANFTNWPTTDYNPQYSGANPACSFSLMPGNASLGPAAEGYMFTVVAPANCGWVVATDSPSWITVPAGAGGSGSASASFTVAANSSSQPRSGNITIADQTFTVTQDKVACSINFGPATPVTVASAGGNMSVALTLGASDCGWTANSNVSWITGVTASGTGSGSVAYMVATNMGAARSGTITILGQNYTVNQLAGVPDTTPPFGSFDTPANGTNNVVGAVAVTGWALDDNGVTKVELYRDPVNGEAGGAFGLIYIGNAVFVTGARPDVQNAYPNYPNANRAGWGYQLLTNFLPNGGNGTFKLHAIAYDAVGHTTELTNIPGTTPNIGRTITCTNSSAAKPFGTIDTPLQGDTITGSAYVNFGWALTPGAAFTIPKDGSTLTVLLDGAPLSGHPVYNQFRNDIATLFPGYNNTGGAVGYYVIDTTKLANGVHTIAWLAFDNAMRGEGLGSRYFAVANGTVGNVPADAEPETEDTTLAPIDPPQTIDMEEMGRIELHAGVRSGYSLVNGNREPLPVGSTLKRGVFYWQLGPGFLGDYDLVLIRRDGAELPLRVRVRPKRFE